MMTRPNSVSSVKPELVISTEEECTEQTVMNMLPQYPRQGELDSVIKALSLSPNSRTRALNLIKVWEADRPSRSKLPEIPGRLTEDTGDRDSQKSKKIVFKNKLFRRKKHVDWDRFLKGSPHIRPEESSMAFLWQQDE